MRRRHNDDTINRVNRISIDVFSCALIAF